MTGICRSDSHGSGRHIRANLCMIPRRQRSGRRLSAGPRLSTPGQRSADVRVWFSDPDDLTRTDPSDRHIHKCPDA